MKQTIASWETRCIERAALGDVEAFEELAERHRPALRSLALRMLRNREDVNDVVQETLVKAFRAIRDFDPERPMRPWLCRICTNCCVDAVRERRYDGDSLDAHEYQLASGEAIDEQAEENFEQGQVLEAVQRLPENYRRIVFMRHFRHMDVNEIAAELKKPEGTIKSWLFRARALLRKDLKVAFG